MPINKVDFAGQTLIDLTKDTVTAASLLQGITAHDKAGNAISGTASGPKPEQVKELDIIENADYAITPSKGKTLSRVLAHVNVPTGGDVSPFSKIIVHEIASRSSSYMIPANERNGLFAVLIIADGLESTKNAFRFCVLSPHIVYSGYQTMYGAYGLSDSTLWANEFGYNGDGEIPLSDTGLVSTSRARVIQMYR